MVSDGNGEARVTLAGTAGRAGETHVAIDVVRPAATGPGVVVGHGETTVAWQAAQLGLRVTAPATAAVGGDVPVTITVANTGQLPTRAMVVRMPIPQGMQFVSGTPLPQLDGVTAAWPVLPVPAGGSQILRAVFRARRPAS